MQGVNLAIVIGNLGRAPELRHSESGQAVANFTIATNERWTDKKGQKQERTEWHRIVVWGKQADACAQYLKSGSACAVIGRGQTREWTNKEGVKQFTHEIVATSVAFLDRKSRPEEPPPPTEEPPTRQDPPADEDFGPPPEG